MSAYTPFGELYSNSPKMIVHGRLRNCATVRSLIDLAQSKGYEVRFEPSGFVNDVKLHEGFDNSAPMRNHTVRSAQRLLEAHPGCD